MAVAERAFAEGAAVSPTSVAVTALQNSVRKSNGWPRACESIGTLRARVGGSWTATATKSYEFRPRKSFRMTMRNKFSQRYGYYNHDNDYNNYEVRRKIEKRSRGVCDRRSVVYLVFKYLVCKLRLCRKMRRYVRRENTCSRRVLIDRRIEKSRDSLARYTSRIAALAARNET